MRIPVVLVHGPGAVAGPAAEPPPGRDAGGGPNGRTRAIPGQDASPGSGPTAENDSSARQHHRCPGGVVHLVADVPAGDEIGPALDRALAAFCHHGGFTAVGTPVRRLGPRPAGGVLVRADGGSPIPARVHADPDAAQLLLCVVSGPGAGTTVVLGRGSHTIGRTHAELTIDDPSISRQHARVDVRADRITVTDCGSVNGVLVDGRATRHAVVTTASHLQIGGAHVRLRPADPTVPTYPTGVSSDLPPPPAAGSTDHAAATPTWWLSGLVPVAVGLVFGIVTGSPLLLLLGLLTAPAALAPALVTARRRRRRRQQRDRDERRWAGLVERAVPDPSLHLIAAHRARPGPGRAPGNTGSRSGALVRVGTTSSDPTVNPRRRYGEVPGSGNAPAVVDLAVTGDIEVRGAAHRVLSLQRNVLVQLSGLSPALNVGVCVVPEVEAMARLLPGVVVLRPDQARHTMAGRAEGLDDGGPADGGPTDDGPSDGGRRDDVPVDALVVDRAVLDRPATDATDATDAPDAASEDAGTPGRAAPTPADDDGPDGTPTIGRQRPGEHVPIWVFDSGDATGKPPRVGTESSPEPVAGGRAMSGVAVRPTLQESSAANTPRPAHVPRRADGVRWRSGFPPASPATPVLLRSPHVRLDLGDPSEIHVGGDAWAFDPDLVPPVVFERYCVWRATGPRPGFPPPDPTALPDRCTLPRRAVGAAPERLGHLSCTLGVTADGPLRIDLATDGPHLLVAGTTGAGKSVLLRTLVLSLAEARPPERLGFVFFDFKGGTALGPLASLPHCDALVTDLGGGTDRVLVSLRAELRHRERLAREYGVDDIESAAVPASRAPGRLVVVVDEFRVLVDEHPEALAQLVRLAAQGRSLGIHLVMATQRPRGALNADIRANTAIRIALRMQSAEESIDVLGDGSAAALPARTPGRGWITVGERAPRLFQTADVGEPTDARSPGLPLRTRVARWRPHGVALRWITAPEEPASSSGAPMRPGAEHRPPTARPSGTDAVRAGSQRPPDGAGSLSGAGPRGEADVADGLKASASPAPIEPARRPCVAPALPHRLSAADAIALSTATGRPADADGGPGHGPGQSSGPRPRQNPGPGPGPSPDPHPVPGAVLGLLDRPDEQRLLAWRHRPGKDPHLAVVGDDPSAVDDVTGHLIAALTGVARVYLLDGTGSLPLPSGGVPLGARVTPDRPALAQRVLERLAAILDARSSTARVGPSDEPDEPDDGHMPDRRADHGESGAGQHAHRPLLLVVNGWSSWFSLWRAEPWSTAEETLLRLAAGGRQGNVGLLVAGGPDLSTGRLGSALGRHVYVPDAGGAVTVPGRTRATALDPVPGRVLVGAAAGPAAGSAPGEQAQLVTVPDRWMPSPGGGAAQTVPADASPAVPAETADPAVPAAAADPVEADPVNEGPVIHDLPRRVTVARVRELANGVPRSPVAGPAASLLVGMGGDGADLAHLTVRPGEILPVLGSPGSGRTTLLRSLAALNPGLTCIPAPGDECTGPQDGPRILLVDDVDRADAAFVQRVDERAAAGGGVVVAVSLAAALSHRVPLIGPALAERRFVVIGADDPAVTVPLGVRLPIDHPAVPGRAVIVRGPERLPVQVPVGDDP